MEISPPPAPAIAASLAQFTSRSTSASAAAPTAEDLGEYGLNIWINNIGLNKIKKKKLETGLYIVIPKNELINDEKAIINPDRISDNSKNIIQKIPEKFNFVLIKYKQYGLNRVDRNIVEIDLYITRADDIIPINIGSLTTIEKGEKGERDREKIDKVNRNLKNWAFVWQRSGFEEPYKYEPDTVINIRKDDKGPIQVEIKKALEEKSVTYSRFTDQLKNNLITTGPIDKLIITEYLKKGNLGNIEKPNIHSLFTSTLAEGDILKIENEILSKLEEILREKHIITGFTQPLAPPPAPVRRGDKPGTSQAGPYRAAQGPQGPLELTKFINSPIEQDNYHEKIKYVKPYMDIIDIGKDFSKLHEQILEDLRTISFKEIVENFVEQYYKQDNIPIPDKPYADFYLNSVGNENKLIIRNMHNIFLELFYIFRKINVNEYYKYIDFTLNNINIPNTINSIGDDQKCVTYELLLGKPAGTGIFRVKEFDRVQVVDPNEVREPSAASSSSSEEEEEVVYTNHSSINILKNIFGKNSKFIVNSGIKNTGDFGNALKYSLARIFDLNLNIENKPMIENEIRTVYGISKKNNELNYIDDMFVQDKTLCINRKKNGVDTTYNLMNTIQNNIKECLINKIKSNLADTLTKKVDKKNISIDDVKEIISKFTEDIIVKVFTCLKAEDIEGDLNKIRFLTDLKKSGDFDTAQSALKTGSIFLTGDYVAAAYAIFIGCKTVLSIRDQGIYKYYIYYPREGSPLLTNVAGLEEAAAQAAQATQERERQQREAVAAQERERERLLREAVTTQERERERQQREAIAAQERERQQQREAIAAQERERQQREAAQERERVWQLELLAAEERAAEARARAAEAETNRNISQIAQTQLNDPELSAEVKNSWIEIIQHISNKKRPAPEPEPFAGPQAKRRKGGNGSEKKNKRASQISNTEFMDITIEYLYEISLQTGKNYLKDLLNDFKEILSGKKQATKDKFKMDIKLVADMKSYLKERHILKYGYSDDLQYTVLRFLELSNIEFEGKPFTMERYTAWIHKNINEYMKKQEQEKEKPRLRLHTRSQPLSLPKLNTQLYPLKTKRTRSQPLPKQSSKTRTRNPQYSVFIHEAEQPQPQLPIEFTNMLGTRQAVGTRQGGKTGGNSNKKPITKTDIATYEKDLVKLYKSYIRLAKTDKPEQELQEEFQKLDHKIQKLAHKIKIAMEK